MLDNVTIDRFGRILMGTTGPRQQHPHLQDLAVRDRHARADSGRRPQSEVLRRGRRPTTRTSSPKTKNRPASSTPLQSSATAGSCWTSRPTKRARIPSWSRADSCSRCTWIRASAWSATTIAATATTTITGGAETTARAACGAGQAGSRSSIACPARHPRPAGIHARFPNTGWHRAARTPAACRHPRWAALPRAPPAHPTNTRIGKSFVRLELVSLLNSTIRWLPCIPSSYGPCASP